MPSHGASCSCAEDVVAHGGDGPDRVMPSVLPGGHGVGSRPEPQIAAASPTPPATTARPPRPRTGRSLTPQRSDLNTSCRQANCPNHSLLHHTPGPGHQHGSARRALRAEECRDRRAGHHGTSGLVSCRRGRRPGRDRSTSWRRVASTRSDRRGHRDGDGGRVEGRSREYGQQERHPQPVVDKRITASGYEQTMKQVLAPRTPETVVEALARGTRLGDKGQFAVHEAIRKALPSHEHSEVLCERAFRHCRDALRTVGRHLRTPAPPPCCTVEETAGPMWFRFGPSGWRTLVSGTVGRGTGPRHSSTEPQSPPCMGTAYGGAARRPGRGTRGGHGCE